MVLQDEIEQSFGTGPAHLPIEDRIEAGRRALRLRRALVALVGTCVVGVIGLTYVVVSPDSDPDGIAGEVAVDPTPPPTPSPSLTPDADPWTGNDAPALPRRAAADPPRGGRARAHREPLPVRTTEPVRCPRHHASEGSGSGRSRSSATVRSPCRSRLPAMAGQALRPMSPTRLTQPATAGRSCSSSATDGTVVANAGQRDRPAHRRAQARSLVRGTWHTDRSSAWCSAGEDGKGYFVVWRVLDDGLDVIVVPPRDVVGATFEELLAYARGQYSSGEGLR